MPTLVLTFFLGWLLPGLALAAEQFIIDVHFAVLTQRSSALARATEAQMRREVAILNTYFKGADGSKPVLFRFKDVVFAHQLPATLCASLVNLGDLKEEYDYTTLMASYRACNDSRLVDPQAINFYVYDSYTVADGYDDITSHGIHNTGHPLVLLDWERLNHTTQSPEEHEFGHVFGLGHVCVPGATLNTSTNIMASHDCGLGSGGRRDIGFDASQLATIGRFATTVVATLGPASQTLDGIFFSAATLSVGRSTVVSSTASSGLAVTFSSITPGICSVSGSTVTGLAVGTCIIVASQAGDASFAAAAQLRQSLAVTLATPACTLSANPAAINSGGSSMLVSSCSPAAASYVWSGGTCAGTGAASCTVSPSITSTYTVTGINASGTGTPGSATVTVSALSIIDHYYTSILSRQPNAGEKAFWQGEVTRMSRLGVSAAETYMVMASTVFTSPEFLARGLADEMFIQTLYRTFLSRAGEPTEVADWKSLLAASLPRNMVMYAFVFSPEFKDFLLQNLGESSQRAEIGAVMDYFRGILGRLPDDAGFKYWVNQFRSAQCSNDAAANVYAAATSIATGFFGSLEYASGAATPGDYVGDLYNAFMRRIADPGGYYYWVDQLTSGALSREQARQAFIDSPEFAARVQAIAGQGCAAQVLLAGGVVAASGNSERALVGQNGNETSF